MEELDQLGSDNCCREMGRFFRNTPGCDTKPKAVRRKENNTRRNQQSLMLISLLHQPGTERESGATEI
ncbi:hypothetical protein KOW79_001698 [Hemibagrus wyckioides]|uniref:Uncharacterized protein n=1 Tax=Hemibagrus wyckioides TaxID=337641 RepID=A0A9D3P9W1_9TELE|nr:hypothetical protein KOW79_001698 [Hemibagrus wyckioides]